MPLEWDQHAAEDAARRRLQQRLEAGVTLEMIAGSPAEPMSWWERLLDAIYVRLPGKSRSAHGTSTVRLPVYRDGDEPGR